MMILEGLAFAALLVAHVCAIAAVQGLDFGGERRPQQMNPERLLPVDDIEHLMRRAHALRRAYLRHRIRRLRAAIVRLVIERRPRPAARTGETGRQAPWMPTFPWA